MEEVPVEASLGLARCQLAVGETEKAVQSLQAQLDKNPDSAVLASMFRWRSLPRILEDAGVLERLIHASDFPFPSNALVFWNRLNPGELLDLCSESNIFERDFRLKQALGLPPACFERGARLLGV